jgi:predicted amidohydrolase
MRNVRVATISMERQSTIDASLATAMIHVDRAAMFQPDIIVLPEACINSRDTPEPAPGNITNQFSLKAQSIGCYIIIPIEEQTEDGILYNTAVVLDPQGEICGKYRKMFPTDYEMADGIMPGTEMPVFTAGFGRFGIATCFDLNFPELISGLAAGGAEIVFFVSAYEGGRQLLQAAMQNNIYIVSAHRGGIGYVVDKSGVLLQKGSRTQPVVVRNLNLDRKILHIDYNWRRLREINAKYGAAIQVDFYQAEGVMALESLTDAITVDEIMQEFDLETNLEYLDRSRRLRSAMLRGEKVMARQIPSQRQ